MRIFKKTALTALALIILAAVSTGILARMREAKMLKIKPGMHKTEVDQLLGAGLLDISGPCCEKCPPGRKQYAYRGNPSLWYGRLEDSLVVCFVDDIVCDASRRGL